MKETVQVRGAFRHFITKYVFTVRDCQAHSQPPSWRITPCRLSVIVYSTYSQVPSISGCLLHLQPEVTKDPPNMSSRPNKICILLFEVIVTFRLLKSDSWLNEAVGFTYWTFNGIWQYQELNMWLLFPAVFRLWLVKQILCIIRPTLCGVILAQRFYKINY